MAASKDHEGAATVESVSGVRVHGVRISTQLLLHWAQIAIAQESAARAGRAELERRLPEVRKTGAGLELALEFHPSMLTAAAAASAIDALYGEVKEDAGVSADVLETWRSNDTPRYAQIFETLKHGFQVKQGWSRDLQWLFKSQRDVALHSVSRGDVPQAHPLGVDTAPEYVIYTCESAARAVDLMLDVLQTCVARPRLQLEQWAATLRGPVANLVAERRAHS